MIVELIGGPEKKPELKEYSVTFKVPPETRLLEPSYTRMTMSTYYSLLIGAKESHKVLTRIGLEGLLSELKGALLVGGAIPCHGLGRWVKDYDIVYQETNDILKLLSSYGEVQKSYLGGYKLWVYRPEAHYVIDFWEMSSMPGFEDVYSEDQSLHDIYHQLVPLNLEQVSYCLADKTLKADGCIEALDTKVIKQSCTDYILALTGAEHAYRRAIRKAKLYRIDVDPALKVLGEISELFIEGKS